MTQPAPACSENDLVAAVRRGSDRAFEELYARYRSRIGSYIFGMVGDHGRAEDIAQEVFISALRRLRETERTVIFKPWIYEIAKNACIDEFRRTRRIHEVPLEPQSDHEFPVAALPSTIPTPDAAVESKQRLTDLRGAFRGLSESHHRILVLRELEGLSYNQIGDRLGMTKPVVESTLFRARRRLGEEFEELESGRRCQRVQSLIAADGERPLSSLGIRERRQFARHVAHCELCRRQARDAGIDESLYRAPNLLGRMAVLAPIPWLRSIAPYFDPSRPGSGVGKAIAAAAIVVAGAGASGGLVSDMTGHASRPPRAVLAAPLPPVTSAIPHPSPGRAAAVAAAHYGVAAARPAGVAAAQVRVQNRPAHTAASTGLPRVPVSALALTESRPQPPTVASSPAGGSANTRGAARAAPTGGGGSGNGQGTQAGSGAAGSSAPSGNGNGNTPSAGVLGLDPGSTASGTLGAVSQGLGSLAPTNGLLSGVTTPASTGPPLLPILPTGGDGSTDATTTTPASPASPASPAEPAGPAGPDLPNLGS